MRKISKRDLGLLRTSRGALICIELLPELIDRSGVGEAALRNLSAIDEDLSSGGGRGVTWNLLLST